MNVIIENMNENCLPAIRAGIADGIIHRPFVYFQTCLAETVEGKRISLLALDNGEVTGWGFLILKSKYDYFMENAVPEINDLFVLEPYRKLGIGSELLRRLEKEARKMNYRKTGLGVGLYADYGTAQRLYVKLGYVPDGSGVHYDYRQIAPGEKLSVDDGLLIFMTKELK